MRDKLDDTVSELMFAGLGSTLIGGISFNNKNDFTINGSPCEVKTIHDEIIIGKDSNGNTVPMSRKEPFGKLSLKTEMVKQILRNKYKEHVSTAISQGGRIIFVNASFSTVAHDFVMIDFNKDVNGDEKFIQLTKDALNGITNLDNFKDIPVIVDAGAVACENNELRWYHTCYSFKASILRDKDGNVFLDATRYDKDTMVDMMNLDDILFKKYAFTEDQDY